MLFPSINHFDSTEVFAYEGFEIVSTHGNVYTVRESDVSFVLCQTPNLLKVLSKNSWFRRWKATYVARARPRDFVAREIRSTCGKSTGLQASEI